MELATFATMFAIDGPQYGLDVTDDEITIFYVNEAGDVGEARQNRRTTMTEYRTLHGETADMVKHWYSQEAREGDRAKLDAGFVALETALAHLSSLTRTSIPDLVRDLASLRDNVARVRRGY
jgi:hypothetical protein